VSTKQSTSFHLFRGRRRFSKRGMFIIMAILALTFIVLDRAGVKPVQQFKMVVLETASPLIEALSQPVYFVRDLLENLEHLAELRTENEALRIEVTALKRSMIELNNLKSENQVLKKQLNFIPENSFGFITARVIADGSGSFARSVIVKAGEKDGIRKGQAVVTGDGLVGRLHEVGNSSSRVVLLEDLNSRIPVMSLQTRDRAILAGNNTRLPTLSYLSETAQVAVGSHIVTSGDGGVFPQGIPIGVVVSTRDGLAKVQLLAQTGKLDFVKIVDYGLTGLLEAK